MLNEYIDKILVHAPDRSSGERIQEVEIYFNFIGRFDVSQPEPTPEEIAAEEKRKNLLIKRRDYLREYRKKRKQLLIQELADVENCLQENKKLFGSIFEQLSKIK